MKKLHLFIYLLLLALILPVKAEQDTIRSLIISEWRGDESEKMPEARETPVQAMFYVSPGGDDGNPGTIQSPFQTLEKARDEVRKINREMTGDIIVYVMAGDYHIHHTIEFKGSDSGTNGYRVIYRNHDEPGSARLLGAIPSIGWEKYDDRRYRISVGEDITVNFLYEDNKRSGPARFPNRAEDRHTYMRVAEEDTLQPTGQFYFREGQLPVMEESSPLAIYFFPGGFDWRQTILPVSLIDYENQKIVTESVSGYGFLEGTRYFIMGHAMELLDAPGELVHHKESGTLYYYPRNEDNIYKNNIYIPLVEKIIEFRGDSMASNQGGTVHNITLEGLTVGMTGFDIFKGADNQYLCETAAISVHNARGIEIRNCRIVNSANNAVAFTGYAKENVVYGNFIHEAGLAGIHVDHMKPVIELISGHNRFQNNFITDVGYLSSGGGIVVAGSGYNEIKNNVICNSLRFGIRVVGPGLSLHIMKMDEIDGVKVDKENPLENLKFMPARGNVIRHNEVFDCNTDSQDSGPITTWGARHTLVDNNLVYGTRGFGSQQGIYMDGGSHFSRVTNNIVYDISSSENGNWGAVSQPFHVKGIESEASNNIFDFTAADGVMGMGFSSIQANMEISENMVFERNILFSFSEHAGPVLRMHDGPGRPLENRFAVIDNNLYFTANGKYQVVAFGHGIAGKNWLDRDTWRAILDNKYDQHSIYDRDPLFVDAANRIYALQPGSPAFDIGFKPIDISKVGLINDYVYFDEILPYMESSRQAKSYVVREVE